MENSLDLLIEESENVQIRIIQDVVLDKIIHKDTLMGLMGRFFKILLRKLRLKQLGRKLFDPSKSSSFDMFDVWPGF